MLSSEWIVNVEIAQSSCTAFSQIVSLFLWPLFVSVCSQTMCGPGQPTLRGTGLSPSARFKVFHAKKNINERLRKTSHIWTSSRVDLGLIVRRIFHLMRKLRYRLQHWQLTLIVKQNKKKKNTKKKNPETDFILIPN